MKRIALALGAFAGMLMLLPALAFGQSAPTQPAPIYGKITAKEPIMVNGTTADNFIFGAQETFIQTPANAEATIEIGDVGSIMLSPGSLISVSGSAGGVRVIQREGCSTGANKLGKMLLMQDLIGRVLGTTPEAEEVDPNTFVAHSLERSVLARADGKTLLKLPVCAPLSLSPVSTK